jgi:2-phosphoglycerate kinase
VDDIFHPWQVLLIGGSSGVGKTFAARALAKQFGISLLLVDDIRMALHQATTPETHPNLHVFLQYQPEQWHNPAAIHTDWIRVGQALVKPLNAVINHHIIVPGVGPLIIEGDGILPQPVSAGVRSIFIVEANEQQLLANLQARGRGFNELDPLNQQAYSHASWLHGQWLAAEAEKLGLPVLDARPQHTILERLLENLSET